MQKLAFKLYVLDDRTLELCHPASGTVYQFSGRARNHIGLLVG